MFSIANYIYIHIYMYVFTIYIYEFRTFHLCLQACIVHVFEQQHKRVVFQKHDRIWSRKVFSYS